MNYESFIELIVNPLKTKKFLFSKTGSCQLILNSDYGFMNENEMVEYLSVLPDIYDRIHGMEYDQLIDENMELGHFIRNIFGLYYPNNPYASFKEHFSSPNSPENVSFNVLKQLWYSFNAMK